MNKLLNTKILIAILVVLVGIGGGIAWLVQDRKAHDDKENAEYYQEMEFKASMVGKPVQQVIDEDKARKAAAKKMN